MHLLPRPIRVAFALAATLLVTYVGLWAVVDTREIGRSDFTAAYVGGVLFRQGHRADLYDERRQQAIHDQLIAPDREGNLPFVYPPTAALLPAPFTTLPLRNAYRLWGALQVLLVVTACVVVARERPRASGVAVVAAIAVALSSPAVFRLLLLGQWSGINALGLALAYRCWRADRQAWGAALLAASALIAKPHVAIGFAAFLVGWRQWRALLGAAAATAIGILVWLAIATPTGVKAWIAIAASDAHLWDPATFVGFTGLTGALLGNTALANGLAGGLAAVGVVGAIALGHRARDGSQLPRALAGATILSVLISPHIYDHDLVVIPVAVTWWLSNLLEKGTVERRTVVRAVWVWMGVVIVELAVQGTPRPGLVVPVLLIGLLAFVVRPASWHRSTAAPIAASA